MWATRVTAPMLYCFFASVHISTPFLIKNTCPAPKPCICHQRVIDCRNKGLTETIIQFSADNMEGFDTLDYGENKITSLLRAAFTGLPNLSTLLLDSNNISNVHQQAFSGVEITLVNINLANNNLAEVPSALCRLRNVGNLNVSGNPITPETLDTSCDGSRVTHGKETVLYMLGKTLKVFSFGNERSINYWPRALIHLQALQNLQVIGSNVQPTAAIYFHGYTLTLKSLTLKYSHLTQIPMDLSNLRQLEELYIDYNMYNLSLDNNIQDIGDTLKVLTLRYNYLSSFPSHIKFLTRLQNLSLEGNDLKFVSDESIAILKLTNISYMSLKNCGLKRIPGSLSDVNTLLQLDLSHNRIVTIEYHDFINVANLQRLSLASNPLKYISSTAFFGLHSLKYLDLSDTDITFMPEGIQNLNAIDILDLRNTRMECTCDMVWVKLWEELNERSGQYVTIIGDCETIDSLIDEYIRRRLPTCPDYLRQNSL